MQILRSNICKNYIMLNTLAIAMHNFYYTTVENLSQLLDKSTITISPRNSIHTKRVLPEVVTRLE